MEISKIGRNKYKHGRERLKRKVPLDHGRTKERRRNECNHHASVLSRITSNELWVYVKARMEVEWHRVLQKIYI